LQAQRACRRLHFGDHGLVTRIGRVPRTPNTAALGITSRSNCNRFGTRSTFKMAMPVRLPPGRLRLATRPDATGSLR
jgi:hypothetical protein